MILLLYRQSTESVIAVSVFALFKAHTYLQFVLFCQAVYLKSILLVLQLCTIPLDCQTVAVECHFPIPGNKGVNNFVFLRPNLVVVFL